LKSLGIPDRNTYGEMYWKRTGFDARPHLPLYLAYNFFRIAGILQGIVGRVRDGTASNQNAAAEAGRVRPMAETAWKFAREAGAR
jgi:aminoglycoside phosphotransferase (APT) family kinase protein